MNLLILFFLALFSACRSYQAQKTIIDPWHGKFLHPSGRFTLILNHFSNEFIAIDIFQEKQKTPIASFFGDIKGSSILIKDRTDADCNFNLKVAHSGIEVSDQCHGTGEIDGLYKRIGDKI